MLTSKKMTLKPLLESSDGIHLTAYLINRGDVADLKVQLRETIDLAYEWLSPVMLADERNKFLEPLDSLLLDAKIFRRMKGNIGIFRNQDTFRVLNVPVEMAQACHVATSFHVKPLLKWLQIDQEFLLLELEKEVAHLYLGSRDSFKHVRSMPTDETFAGINEWLHHLTKRTKPKLYVTGEKSLVEILHPNLSYENAVKTSISSRFDKRTVSDICSSIRKILKVEAKVSIKKALIEFRIAEEANRGRKNIFQISKAVVQKRVRKLIVTDELNIFGKIDKKSGGISIHPYDLDHEDDDLLDDLAQMVLRQGGEVIIASRDDMPKGRPILAILDGETRGLEKHEELRKQFEDLQERFG